MVLRVKPTPTRFPASSLYTRWTTHHRILYQVCDTRGTPSLLSYVATEIVSQLLLASNISSVLPGCDAEAAPTFYMFQWITNLALYSKCLTSVMQRAVVVWL